LPACDRAVGAGGTLAPELDPAAPATSSAHFTEVQDFRLVRQDGEPVSYADLAGAPWIVASFFTRCMGPCPRISASMAELQIELADTPARLVSLSVDPTFDSPEVLTSYAERYGADPERWWFLTGEEKDVYHFVRHSILVAAGSRPARPGAEDDEHDITHEVRLCVIDGEGRVRGWYHHEDERELLVERVRYLLQE
jgi:protein SCO1/2/putative membrane protein